MLGFEPRNTGTKNRGLTAWRHPIDLSHLSLWQINFWFVKVINDFFAQYIDTEQILV